MGEHKNPYPGENNTGHFWDDDNDIRELNNRPPRWYMWALYLGIIAIPIYSFYYPTIPWFGEHTKGTAGWTQIVEYKEGVKQLEDYRQSKFADIEKTIADPKTSLEDIVRDDELRSYSIKTAKVLFGDNCAACHGAGGQGNDGFPVLADDDWLYGGTLAQISTSITNGRKGNMPARMMGISDADADTLATFLVETGKGAAGKPNPASKSLYMTKGCIGCHGPTMKGNVFMGSANLSDGIYRFKADDQKASVIRTILHGVNQGHKPLTQDAVMPSFGASKVIDKTQIKKLAVYVHQLGGGVAVKPKPKPKKVVASAAAPTAKAGRGGKELYAKCQGCHNVGVGGAPKYGDKAAWAPRIKRGMDDLLKVAKAGKGMMPPKGTCMDCTDDELRAVIQYMMESAGAPKAKSAVKVSPFKAVVASGDSFDAVIKAADANYKKALAAKMAWRDTGKMIKDAKKTKDVALAKAANKQAVNALAQSAVAGAAGPSF
ncbi:MAG TPA: cytochrome-c oxidase, cbb3-type subunit III [Gammaproteobacteria bacterium]|jgi:cytochrome c oxidase cbb3-type subunit 3|nr:cytochrome-c oxidase, cbb3-type subunit III [Gammaproteobacteria bacterium]HAO38609.1 cytochrome-c oxidase, cbb3-type subunit III [Gammaproteobacteria bacterium]HAO53775.1 cytochrome-c oxidase, cbb3-type subunit III [Gammaproteobacteria bacterium]HAP05610.1 cytochrome-c oxidase, cbb3-type subunit III [Gammaproteobacteria bacterium]HAP45314.1 cytochrome-c oxidase, cbb3-type subunit III [Gammaproteobacteria bacterium]